MMGKESIFLTVLGLVLLLLAAPQARTQAPSKIKDDEERVRLEMIQISRELGTNCAECHNVNDFKDSSRSSYKTAQKHLKIVNVMKANGMDGRQGPEANCYMCHRGELRPPARAPESTSTSLIRHWLAGKSFGG